MQQPIQHGVLCRALQLLDGVSCTLIPSRVSNLGTHAPLTVSFWAEAPHRPLDSVQLASEAVPRLIHLQQAHLSVLAFARIGQQHGMAFPLPHSSRIDQWQPRRWSGLQSWRGQATICWAFSSSWWQPVPARILTPEDYGDQDLQDWCDGQHSPEVSQARRMQCTLLSFSELLLLKARVKPLVWFLSLPVGTSGGHRRLMHWSYDA